MADFSDQSPRRRTISSTACRRRHSATTATATMRSGGEVSDCGGGGVAVRGGALSRRTAVLSLLVLTSAWTFRASSAYVTSDNSPTSSSAAGGSDSGTLMTHYNYNNYNDNSYYSPGSQGLGEGSYLTEFDETWAKMSGRVQRPTCVDIPANLSLCQNIGYKRMLLPNLLQHDTLTEVAQQARSWVPLVNLRCHPDTKLFLCSLFSPVCLDREIYPCRPLCENVRNHCLQRMKHYGFEWPVMLKCDRFPETNGMCINPLHHGVDKDTTCGACNHPLTYAAIIDNYCRAEFVSRVGIERKEPRGADQALILKKSKRYYKKDKNITKKERTSMTPLVPDGSSCTCDAINDTSKRYLIMGSHRGQDIVLSFVAEFQKNNKEVRRAFKDIRKGNVCKRIIQELSKYNQDKTEAGFKGDGICPACRMPVTYVTIVENYCLADYVLRVKVKAVEARDGHQVLVLTKSRKNFKKGTITRKEEKAMVPLLDGKEGCTCELVASQKSRFLIFGSKRDGKYFINYVTAFNKKDPEFKKAMRAIRKGAACGGKDAGTGGGGKSGGGGGKGKAGGKKGKKRKGKKGKKGKKRKRGKKGRKGNKNSTSSNEA